MDERQQLADSVRPESHEAALASALDVIDREAGRVVLASLAPTYRPSRLDGYLDSIRGAAVYREVGVRRMGRSAPMIGGG